MAILGQDNPWEDKPYPYQPGGTFLGGQGAAGTGQEQAGGAGIMGALAPMLGSLYAPNQGQPASQPPPQAPVQPPMQYTFGSEESQSAPFADRLGQGVLAASQNALKQGGMGGGKKKKLGQQQDSGDAGLGATPGSEGY